ncbi:hypothetical protein BaRGS_00011246 [Batillaria attramentaria]|uniref:Secreted protein n=1 Tax=Batillaria attramentaria TaxID=370345 RepID=A0ABD0LDN5_9CAEN
MSDRSTCVLSCFTPPCGWQLPLAAVFIARAWTSIIRDDTQPAMAPSPVDKLCAQQGVCGLLEVLKSTVLSICTVALSVSVRIETVPCQDLMHIKEIRTSKCGRTRGASMSSTFCKALDQ